MKQTTYKITLEVKIDHPDDWSESELTQLAKEAITDDGFEHQWDLTNVQIQINLIDFPELVTLEIEKMKALSKLTSREKKLLGL